MEGLTSTTGVVALAAAGLALVLLVWQLVTTVRLRRIRAAQRVVLGPEGTTDLVHHAADLEAQFRDLQGDVSVAFSHLDDRMETVERWLDGAITYRAIVHYDAFDEMSGQQSCSIALLDARASGIVLTHLMRRDQARLYVRRVVEGHGEHQLAPEEEEAIRMAVADGRAGAGA